MAWLLTAVVFVLATAAVLAAGAGLAQLSAIRVQRRLAARLREGARAADVPAPSIVRQQVDGPLPALDQLVRRSRYASALSRLVDQAGLRVGPGTIVLTSIASALGVSFFATSFLRPWFTALTGIVALILPVVLLRRRRTKRFKRFEEQFPEALDLLARGIRAGHGFTTAMGMVAEELGDPVGPEFRKTVDEHNFGLPLKDALNGLRERIPLLDVRFFATAVLIQRETGGNLSEILENLARVVRERFKILRQVRVYTAHGRFTGYVLMALPAGLLCVLTFINPEHVGVLFTERMGRVMLGGALFMQAVGYLWIRRVIRIEV